MESQGFRLPVLLLLLLLPATVIIIPLRGYVRVVAPWHFTQDALSWHFILCGISCSRGAPSGHRLRDAFFCLLQTNHLRQSHAAYAGSNKLQTNRPYPLPCLWPLANTFMSVSLFIMRTVLCKQRLARKCRIVIALEHFHPEEIHSLN